MTTTVTKNIGSAAGRDYATFAAWKAYVEGRGDLTGADIDEVHVGLMYADSVFNEATLIMPTNPKDATHTVTLMCAPGQSFRDVKGALRYNEANGVAIRFTSNTSAQFSLGANCVIDGLQILATGTVGGGQMLVTNAGLVQNSIIDGGTAMTGTTAVVTANVATGIYRNVVVVSNIANLFPIQNAASTVRSLVESCTFVNTAGSTVAVVNSSSTARCSFTNCVAVGFIGRAWFNTAGNPNVSYCATDGTAAAGATNIGGISGVAQFQNVASAATLDLRLLATASLRGAGVTSATNPTDIFGRTRPSPPSIGPHEYVAPSSFVAPRLRWCGQAVNRASSY